MANGYMMLNDNTNSGRQVEYIRNTSHHKPASNTRSGRPKVR